MTTSVEQIWKAAHKAEKELHAVIADKSRSLADLSLRLEDYRAICDSVIFQDFEFALNKHVEGRLWDAHGKVNLRARKHLSFFREGDGKKRLVEQRKAMKQYLDFIKSSQRYYRGFIQNLAANFGGIREVEAVAGRFNPENSEWSTSDELSVELRLAVLLSCHRTLVRLGDLSRYRETELVAKERNWGPAIGYYNLAEAIRPSSGASHNQLAVIALADGNHLRAIYHLYRALAVDEPHPTAKGNLEIEFKKVLTAWDKGEMIPKELPRDSQGPGKALLGWFMRLHARCYKGIDFAEHEELENEVLSQLAIDLKERSLEGTIQKFVLINISAEFFASVRYQDSPDFAENRQAFFFFQRLNVKTFFSLLQVLQPELERFGKDRNTGHAKSAAAKESEKITAVARRVLPSLRHYGSWLVTSKHLLVAGVGDVSHNVQIKELWKIYASTLTLLAATFSVTELPMIEYLLEEDEDTLGFKPFEDDHTRYYGRFTGMRKSKYHDRGIERHHPNLEMLARIRDFVTDGLELSQDEDVPIDLITGTSSFAYREEGIPSELLASPENQRANLSLTYIERDEIPSVNQVNTSSMDDKTSLSVSASVSVSANLAMKRMVDNIVGSSEVIGDSSRQPHAFPRLDSTPRAPFTPPDCSLNDSLSEEVGNNTSYDLMSSPTAQRLMQQYGTDTSYGLMGTLTAQELIQQAGEHEQTHTHGTPYSTPILPSILNSPFAPLTSDTSPRPLTAKAHVKPPQPLLLSEYDPSFSVSSIKVPSSFSPKSKWVSPRSKWV